MTENEILEGNILIAEFMGWKSNVYPHLPNRLHMEDKSIGVEQLEYHSSWDWIMQVVDKIIEIDITPAPNWSGYRVEIVPRGYVQVSGFPMTPVICTNVSICGSLIIAVWKAVVEFVKYHNSIQTA